ncbi:DNA-directed RNA polymerase, subunit E'' [Candidatus Bathyarchaeota archaeon]|nr:DNA-directed RNA polymerase, subunit E'' [Candidatus Bathyarchaeota archaeon]
MSEKACRQCKFISRENRCPNCNSTDLSDDFSGFVIILDAEGSEIAKIMNITRKGKYALKVR